MNCSTIRWPLAVASLLLVASIGRGYYKTGGSTVGMTQAAATFAQALTAEQKSKTLLPIDSPQRADWHIIPKDTRKGLQLNEMNEAQRQAAFQLLRSVLSDVGYRKSTQIMEMEKLLKFLESNKKNSPIRDSTRYYFTLFGQPEVGQRWGLSIEGHHLSLNFLIDGDRVVSSTPQAFAANPAVVRSDNPVGVALGTRVLRYEETLAFELVQSLSDAQQKLAILAETAPRETRTLGVPQPTAEPASGIPYGQLAPPQRKLLERLVDEYIRAVPEDVAEERRQAIAEKGGWPSIHFAWEGATQPGIGHYYRIQGPTFLIEFVNTQPDAAGNIANHIHCLWRDIRGDFGMSL
jgi:hypothetical protein